MVEHIRAERRQSTLGGVPEVVAGSVKAAGDAADGKRVLDGAQPAVVVVVAGAHAPRANVGADQNASGVSAASGWIFGVQPRVRRRGAGSEDHAADRADGTHEIP